MTKTSRSVSQLIHWQIFRTHRHRSRRIHGGSQRARGAGTHPAGVLRPAGTGGAFPGPHPELPGSGAFLLLFSPSPPPGHRRCLPSLRLSAPLPQPRRQPGPTHRASPRPPAQHSTAQHAPPAPRPAICTEGTGARLPAEVIGRRRPCWIRASPAILASGALASEPPETREAPCWVRAGREPPRQPGPLTPCSLPLLRRERLPRPPTVTSGQPWGKRVPRGTKVSSSFQS